MIIYSHKVDACNLCGHVFGNAPCESKIMYDARFAQGWANACHSCFTLLGGELGTGLGQRYELQAIGDRFFWVKTGG